MSGAMLSAGRAGEAPTPAGQYLVDAITAYTAFEGALAALFHRERTGEGQLVQVNMLDAIATIQMQELSVFTVGHKQQKRSAEPHAHVFIRAPYGAFATSDGYIVIAFPSLKKLGAVIGERQLPRHGRRGRHLDPPRRDFRQDQGTAEGQDLRRMAAAVLGRRPVGGPVYGYRELVEDEQVKHNGTFVEYDHPTEGHVKTPGFPIKFSKTPSTVDRGAPLAGEHTREVLGEAGYDAATIDRLEKAGVIAAAKP